MSRGAHDIIGADGSIAMYGGAAALRHHAPRIRFHGPQLQREGLERGGHVNRRSTGIAEHQPDKRFLHRIGRSSHLALQRLDWDLGHFEILAADPFEDPDYAAGTE